MKSVLIKIILFVAVLISTSYLLGDKQILAKQNNKNVPIVDFHYNWLDLYVGFDIENTSQYTQIGYEISYIKNDDQTMVVKGIIDNSTRHSFIEREKIILGSCSTGGTCIYDNRTSPVTLTLNFSRSHNGHHFNYSVTEILK